jgi:hypothetical protein
MALTMPHLLCLVQAGISRILASGLDVVPPALAKLVANIAMGTAADSRDGDTACLILDYNKAGGNNPFGAYAAYKVDDREVL